MKTTSTSKCLPLVFAVSTVILIGCSEERLAPASPTVDSMSLAATALQTPAVRAQSAHLLSRAFAIALSDSELRQQILEDLRDSPFQKKAIHLGSYLKGQRGSALTRAAAHPMGLNTADVLRLFETLPPAQLMMPRVVDRLEWTGTDDLVVFFASRPIEDIIRDNKPVIGFDLSGNEVVFDPYRGPKAPLLVAFPIVDAQKFGDDPEARRAAAPHNKGRSISTPHEERESITIAPTAIDPDDPCAPPYNTRYGCPDYEPPPVSPPIGGFGPGATFQPGISMQECTGLFSLGIDRDRDRIRDECEYLLAAAFSPILQLDAGERHSYHEPHWSVSLHPNDPQSIQIFYALAYHFDGGATFMGISDWYAHFGDSEFIIVEANNPSGTTWLINWVTYSAHWNSLGESTQRVYYPNVEFLTERKTPVSWVSKGKHANYRSRSACNSGGFMGIDRCTPSGFLTPTNVYEATNIGNRFDISIWGSPLIDQVTSRNAYMYPGVEYFWTEQNFWGWSDMAGTPFGNQIGSATPYVKALKAFRF